MKNQTIKNTIGLMAFVMLVVATHSVSAYVPGVWENAPRSSSMVDQTNDGRNGYGSNDVTLANNTGFTTYDQNDYATGNGMTISDETQSNNNSSTKKATTTKTTTISNTKNVTNNNSESTVSDDSKVLEPVTTIDDTNNFGASASNSGFMPTTFWGWLMIIFLILIAIILLRLATRPKQTGSHSAH